MRLALAAIIALTTAACDMRPPPVPAVDAWRADAGRSDAGRDAAIDGHVDASTTGEAGMDAAVDANADAFRDDSGADVGFDAPAIPDANVDANIDAGHDVGVDANVDAWRPDGGPCDPDSFNVCLCRTFGTDCAGAPCATGESCVVDECGMHCVQSGNPCADATDCPTTSSCTGGVCTHAGGGCADSRDCPRGFACEAGTCNDRRIGCRDLAGLDCPYGFSCDEVGTSFCSRVLHHCGTSTSCLGNTCIDVDGDGQSECIFNATASSGGCHRNANCPARLVCSAHPDTRFNTCSRYGACRTAADCPVGMLCQDLWGDGISECVETGGTCSSLADCAGRSVCATPADGGPPACIAVPFGA